MSERLWRRVLNAFTPAVINLVDDSGGAQTAQVAPNALEINNGVPVIHDYGFTSVPHPGAIGAALFMAGDRSGGIIIGVNDRRYRLTGLVTGEVAIYDDLGAKVHLTRAGIVIDGGGQNVTIQNAPTIVADVDLLKIRGDIIDNYPTNAHTAAAFRTEIYNPHTHIEHDGGTTQPPVPQA